jgi:hypothetical protein
VADVRYLGVWRDAPDDTLHHAYVAIFNSEIGSQGNEAHQEKTLQIIILYRFKPRLPMEIGDAPKIRKSGANGGVPLRTTQHRLAQLPALVDEPATPRVIHRLFLSLGR